MKKQILQAVISFFFIAALAGGCNTEQPNTDTPTEPVEEVSESIKPIISSIVPSTTEKPQAVTYYKLDIPMLEEKNILNAEVVWGPSDNGTDTLYIGVLLQPGSDDSVYQIWAYNIENKTIEKVFSLSKNDVNTERFHLVKTKYLQLINNKSLCIKDKDGKQFYFFDIESKQLQIVDYPTKNTTDSFISPDGKYFLYINDNILSGIDKDIHLYNIESGKIMILCKDAFIGEISENSKYIITMHSMSPDIEDAQLGFHIWDTTGKLLYTFESDTQTVAGSQFSWSSDNYLLFSTLSFDEDRNGITTVYLLDVNSGSMTEYASEYGGGLISPDARYSIIIGDINQLLDLQTGKIIPFVSPSRVIRSKDINLDSNSIAISVRESGGEFGIYILNINI